MKIKMNILRDWGMDSQKGENSHQGKEKSHWWRDQAKLGSINVKAKEVAKGSSMEVASQVIRALSLRVPTKYSFTAVSLKRRRLGY